MFSQSKQGVHRGYGDGSGRKQDMYKFGDMNFSKVAEEMGCFAIRVERLGEISGALKKALAVDVACLIF